MAIRIPFLADVAELLRGTSDAEEALEDVADALDDLGRKDTDDLEQDLKDLGKAATEAGKDSETAGEKIESSFDEAAKSADGSAEKIERSFKESFRAVEVQGLTSSRKVKADVDEIGTKGSATLKEFSSEAKQNVAESVSSFTGSAESAVDAVQSTFGGLVSALGPAGVVGAAMVAAGIGLVRGMATKAEEAVKAVAENAASIVGELIGATPEIERINRALEEMATTATTRGKFWWADASTELIDLKVKADQAGVSFEDLALGMAGNSGKLEASLAAVNEQLRINQSESDPRNRGKSVEALIKEEAALKDLRTQLESSKTAQDLAEASAQAYADTAEGQAEATKAAAQALEDENEELAENARLKGDAAEAAWDMADALDAVTVKGKSGKATLDENTKAGRDNAREVKKAVDAINSWAEAQTDAGVPVDKTNQKLKEQEDALVKRVAPAFGGSTEKAREYVRALGGIPRKKETDVKVDDNGTTKATKDEIDTATRDRSTRVNVDTAGLAETERELNRLTRDRTVKVRFAVSGSIPGEHSGSRVGESTEGP